MSSQSNGLALARSSSSLSSEPCSPMSKESPMTKQRSYPQRKDLRHVSPSYGDLPLGGPGDFDLCFQFVLPDYHLSYLDGSESCLERQRAHDKQLEANNTFTRKLLGRHHGTLANATFQNQVETLFRDLLVDSKIRDGFVCGEISNLEDARITCIDMLLHFFRNDVEPYYSYMFTSIDSDEIFLCVKMLPKTAMHHAHHSNYPLQLDMEMVRSREGLNINLGEGSSDQAAFRPAYVKWKKHQVPLLQKHKTEDNPDVEEYLRKLDHIRLLYDRVTDVFDIELMKKWFLLIDYFPLHSKAQIKMFNEEWATARKLHCLDQPIQEIRDYFGEYVALYFVFAQHLAIYMGLLCVFSLLAMVMNLVATGGGNFGDRKEILATLGGLNGLNGMVPALAIFTTVVVNVMIVHLRRKVKYYMNVWGMDHDLRSDVKTKINPRFAARASTIRSDVDQNKMELDVPHAQKQLGRGLSLVGRGLFIIVLICTTAFLFGLKAKMIELGHPHWASVVSFLTPIQIKGFRSLWDRVNVFLTDHEYHKVLVDYEMHSAAKTSYISFVNNYAGFYYIAFMMKILNDTSYKAYGSTWQFLTYQTLTTFGIYFLVSCYEVISPAWALMKERKTELAKLKALGRLRQDATKLEYSYIELQGKMLPCHGFQDSNYIDLVDVFGFVVLFGITNPLISLLAFVYIALQIRVDAWTHTHALRRPYPRTPGREFVWIAVLERLVLMANVTNAWLLCFCSEEIGDLTETQKYLALFLYLFCVRSCSTLVALVVPETPRDVELAQLRHKRQQRLAVEYTGTIEALNTEPFRFRGRSDIDFRCIPPLTSESALKPGIFVVPPGEEEATENAE